MKARSLAIVRAVAVVGGTAALIVGATLASFEVNTVSMSGTTLGVNQITDNLRIYDFSPGGFATSTDNPNGTGPINLTLTLNQESAKQRFYLQNIGATSLILTMSASGTPAGGLDPAKVKVRVYDDAAFPNQLIIFPTTLADLLAGDISINPLGPYLAPGAAGSGGNLGVGWPGNYLVSFELISSAGGTQTLSGINIEFSGIEV